MARGNSGDNSLVGPLVAVVIDPADRDLVAGLAALEAELHKGIFGHGRAPLGAHAAVEWVDLASVERCRDLYLAVAAEFCR